METINKQYIVDEQNKKIAVQIPIKVFERMEEILENYALVHLMKQNEGKEIFCANEAKAYYGKLENNTVTLERALHRKDIYRYFP